MMQLLPEARIPVVNQVSSIETSPIGMRARYCATSAPWAFCSATPTSAQSACRMPDDVYHLPDATKPPSTRLVSNEGAKTPATRASLFAPKTSSWALWEKSPVNQAQTFVNATTHAEPPQPSASAADTSRCDF